MEPYHQGDTSLLFFIFNPHGFCVRDLHLSSCQSVVFFPSNSFFVRPLFNVWGVGLNCTLVTFASSYPFLAIVDPPLPTCQRRGRFIGGQSLPFSVLLWFFLGSPHFCRRRVRTGTKIVFTTQVESLHRGLFVLPQNRFPLLVTCNLSPSQTWPCRAIFVTSSYGCM